MASRRSIQQFESGLDELVSYRDRSQPQRGPHGLDEAAKRKWANCDLYEVWQLVALHNGVDPDSLGTSPEAAIRALRHSLSQLGTISLPLLVVGSLRARKSIDGPPLRGRT